jgi:hypothetical protein
MNPTSAELQATVKERFAKVALWPDQEQKFPVGPASAEKLGYDPKEIDSLPQSVTESFCGVGNPLGLGELRPGQTVLELGSGPGLDSLLAARRVGPSGKVVGVDLFGAGHSFIVFLGDGFYPLNVLNTLKIVPEVCRLFCATVNPTEVVLAETEQGRSILSVVDGFPPKGVEDEGEIQWRSSAHWPTAATTSARSS